MKRKITDNKAEVLRVESSSIPQILKESPHWVLWKAVPDGGDRFKKPPICVDGEPASIKDSGTWETYETIWEAYTRQCRSTSRGGIVAGIGYVLNGGIEGAQGKTLIGLDLDHCINEVGELDERATRIVDRFRGRAYIERSPSGTGVRIFGWSRTELSGKRDGIEVYSRNRYLTVTGQTLPGSESTEWDDCTEDFRWVWKTFTTAEKGMDYEEVTQQPIPVPYEPGKAYAALQYIDPDEDYDQWLTVLMALHQTGWDEAITLAMEWSRGGEKWNSGAFHRKWRSFSRGHKQPVGIGTLYQIGRERGWTGEWDDSERGRYWKEKENPLTEVRILGGERPTPEEVPLPEGLVKTIRDWAARRAYLIQPVFDLGVGLLGTALLTANRYVIGAYNTPLQPYLLFSVPSGGGKEHLRRCLVDLSFEAGMEGSVLSGSQSWHALFDQLAGDGTHTCCFLMDEFGSYLTSSRRGSQENSIIAHLTSLYGLGSGRFSGIAARKSPIPPIDRPFLLFGGSSQPDMMKDGVDHELMQNGLMSRLLYLPGSATIKRNPLMNPQAPVPVVDYFLGVKDLVNVDCSVAILRRIEAYLDESHQKASGSQGVIRSVYARRTQQALIVSGLLAVGRDAKRPIITDECWNYGVWMAEQSIQGWEDLLLDDDLGGTGTPRGSESNKARQAIMRCLGMPVDQKNRLVKTEGDLEAVSLGLTPYRVLSRVVTQRASRRFFEEELEALIQEGTLVAVSRGKSTAYRLAG